jgi:hypothetical protein
MPAFRDPAALVCEYGTISLDGTVCVCVKLASSSSIVENTLFNALSFLSLFEDPPLNARTDALRIKFPAILPNPAPFAPPKALPTAILPALPRTGIIISLISPFSGVSPLRSISWRIILCLELFPKKAFVEVAATAHRAGCPIAAAAQRPVPTMSPVFRRRFDRSLSRSSSSEYCWTVML